MLAELIAFLVLGVLAVVTGALVFRVDSMARATYLLFASFACVAGVMLLLDLAYLGTLTILMMVMEMAIMGVFMVMFMMNPGGLEPMSMLHNRTGALVISGGVFAGLVAAVLLVPWPRRPEPTTSPGGDATRQLGTALMGESMLAMMVVGVALFATIIAATVLATTRGRYGRASHHPARRQGTVDASHHEPSTATHTHGEHS
ncbi:NADH-quinone oxidoreductase subunit J [Haloechinothrix salitolerans]|uniref:NADH-quinone oxidoreductase subunit J n=1 Tax=Haloechinothrix salitolerans TaxID=926830 RepID=A0ABW2C2M0_9PSEU